MLNALVAATLGAFALTQPTDTIIPVERGARLDLENQRGEVVIGTWDRSAVRIIAEHDDREWVAIDKTGSILRVRSRRRMGLPGGIDYRITLPAWMAVKVVGPFSDVSIDGTESDIEAETIQGDIIVRGGGGHISVRSVEGEVELTDSRADIEAGTVNGDITVLRGRGMVRLNAVNGDIDLTDLRSDWVAAATVNGDVDYRGTIDDDGRYRLATHNGDISMTIPESANATVSVSTHSGDLETDFPIQLTDFKSGRRFRFVLGSGTAEIEIEAFQGTIELRRPGRTSTEEDR